MKNEQMTDLEKLRHSSAHVMAAAVCRLFDDVQLDIELLGDPERIIALNPVTIAVANGMRMPFDAKAGKEVDALDLDTLLLNQSGRQ